MNFNQLEYIISVDRHRNFARAADECKIAQSTLSREIQRLEKEFKVMIFDRSRHPVVPTMKGIDLIKQAAELFMTYKPDFMSHLLLSHLSKNNNSPELVQELFNAHAENVKIIIASRYEETEVFRISLNESIKQIPFYQPVAKSTLQLSLPFT
jgi:LysR family hydrogen peroxide-inducible transcriptional activator